MSVFATNVIRGWAWMVGARWSMRVLGLISTVILVRLLQPEDFGVIAMAMIVVGFLETLTDGGVELAVMRKASDSREHLNTAWTVQVLQGLVIASLLLLLAPLTSVYFEEPRAAAVMQVLALRAMVVGFQNIGVVAFRKELDFAKEFRFMLYSKLINFVVLVGAAFWFRNYWAMVIALLVGGFVTVWLSYAMHPFRPRLSLKRVKDIWNFSQWLIFARTGAYISQRCDGFVLGGALGASAMGSYHVASELSGMPTSELVMPVRRALYPTLTALGNDQTAFNASVLSSLSGITVVCVALGFGLFAVAEEVVRLFLGNQWLAIVPLMQLLAIRGCFSSIVLILEVPLWAKGRTKLSALPTWLELVVLVPALIVLVESYGAIGAAVARLATVLLIVPVMLYVIVRLGWFAGRDLWAQLWRPLVAGGLMTLVVLHLPSVEISLAASLAYKVAAGALVYAASLFGLWAACGRPEGFEATVSRRVRRWIVGG